MRSKCPQATGCGQSCDALVQCEPGQECVNDACEDIVCAEGLTGCKTNIGSRFVCADLQSSLTHCGGCGEVCQGQCVAGKCETLQCEQGLTACNGKCTDLAADVASCGGCGLVCPQGSECIAGACQCPDGMVAITRDFPSPHALCVDPKTDALACGDERAVCASMKCEDGECVEA